MAPVMDMIIGRKALLRASQAFACFLIFSACFALKPLWRTLPLRFRYEGNIGLMVVGSHARGNSSNRSGLIMIISIDFLLPF